MNLNKQFTKLDKSRVQLDVTIGQVEQATLHPHGQDRPQHAGGASQDQSLGQEQADEPPVRGADRR